MTRSDEDIFQDALDQPAADRAAWLETVCRGDADRRVRLAALLEAHDEAARYFAAPLLARVAVPSAEQPGDRMGNYTLREKLGEGGCGVVWRATQEAPVRREVALKVIKLGMDTKEVIARFEAERQALARMEHPHIARVFEAGSTGAGRPFFVMELVRGVPITRYCDEHRLSPAARLALVADVCHAIQHAHRKGIIHRDIKPSNVLVAATDGRPVAKVIDFGIAKATEGRLSDATVVTALAQFIGTPAYMSPEQAQPGGSDLDTRTDIYSLGVLLYELLAGRPPFDPQALLAAGLDEVRRVIREVEPMRLSTRIHTLGAAERAALAARCGASVGQLAAQIGGDLDWIVLKALEKDRTRRYDTPGALAADLERFLRHEPVTARPPSAMYLLGKLVRRRRLAFAAGTAVGLALLLGGVFSTWQAVRATRAEREQTRLLVQETAQRRRAEEAEMATRRRAYIADINLVQQALANDQRARARELLDRQRPGAGQTDLRGWEWRHLWRAARSDPHVTLAVKPDTTIVSLAASADGRWLAAGEEKHGQLTVWDLQTREEIRVPADVASVRVAFSPTEPLLAFATATGEYNNFEGRVRLWDARTRTVVWDQPLEAFCGGLVFAADGRSLIVLAGGDRRKPASIARWRVADGSVLLRYPIGTDTARIGGAHFAVSPDGTRAAYFTSGDRRIRVFDLVRGTEVWSAPGAQETVLALAFSPDGTLLLSGAGYTESAIRLWDAATGTEVGRLEGHRRFVSQFVFPDSRTVVSTGGDGTLRVWDLPARRLRQTLSGHTTEATSLALLPDGRTAVSGGKDGAIRLWDLARPPAKEEPIVLPSGGPALRFSDRGDAILALAPDNRAMVEHHGKDFAHQRVRLAIPAANYAAFAPTAALVATRSAGEAGPILRVWDWERGHPIWEKALANTWILQFSPGGERLFLAHQRADKSTWLQEWSPAEDRQLREWPMPFNSEVPVISPDGRFFAVHSNHGRYFLVTGGADQRDELVRTELATGESRRLPAVTREMMRGASFSPDGALYAAPSLRGFADIVAVGPWARVATLTGITTAVHSTLFSADGSRLFTGCSGAESVLIWDTATWSRVLTLGAGKSVMSRLVVSPDGSTIAAASASGGIFVWSAPSWAEIAAAEREAH
jgi:serine/threonine protein kinase/WD40 repeat protein